MWQLCFVKLSLIKIYLFLLYLFYLFITSFIDKWVPASAGKAKAGMVHSVSGWTRGVQVKLWDPLRTRAIPERLRGVFTTRRYTNPRLPLPYLTSLYLCWKLVTTSAISGFAKFGQFVIITVTDRFGVNIPPVRLGVKLVDSLMSGDPRDLAEHVTGLSDDAWSTTNCWTLTVLEQVNSGRKAGSSSDCRGRQKFSVDVGSRSTLLVLMATTGFGWPPLTTHVTLTSVTLSYSINELFLSTRPPSTYSSINVGSADTHHNNTSRYLWATAGIGKKRGALAHLGEIW